MRVLVTGAAGMLGADLVPCLERRGHRVSGLDLDRADITDRAAVESVFKTDNPELVIHAAAWTNVETAEKRPEDSFRVNVDGAANVATSCCSRGARMILIGTDFVFDGAKSGPYVESDPVGPLNVYGRSKLLGEIMARQAFPEMTVVRTAWLYGAGGGNFLTRILRASTGRKSLRVVEDETGSPTWAADLSELLADMAGREKCGTLYHAAGGGCCSRFELARELCRLLAITNVQLRPVAAASFPSPVKRPANSGLASERLEADGFNPLRPWRAALADFVTENEERLMKAYRGVDG